MFLLTPGVHNIINWLSLIFLIAFIRKTLSQKCRRFSQLIITFSCVFSFAFSCLYNCGPKVIPSKRMIIESNCTEELCKNITEYRWSLFKLGAVDSSHSWMEITDLTDLMLTELDNPSLVLAGKLEGNKYSLEMNTTYKVKGSIIVEGGSVQEDEIIFQTVSPLSVSEKRCNVAPVEGFVLKTNFTVNCSGWLTDHVDLTFTFRYVPLKLHRLCVTT